MSVGDGGRSTLATPEEVAAERLAGQISAHPAVIAEAPAVVELWRDRLAARIGPLGPEDEARLAHAVEELAFGCAQLAANSDPARPAVTWVESPPHTWFGMEVAGGRYAADNPDTIYRQVPVDGASTYVIEGRFVGDRPASSVYQAVSNPLLPTPVPGGQLDGPDLVVGPDGRFTITVAPDGTGPNHLRTGGRAAQVFLRDTLSDWSSQSAPALTVHRVGGPSPANGELGPLADMAARDFRAAGRQWIDFYILGVLFQPAANEVPAPVHASGISRSSGHFDLEEDQALLITVDPAGATYISVVVYDVWSVTPDYWSRQTSLTNAQALAGPDGTYTFVVCGPDPGAHNWVDTAGLRRGTFLVRWQGLPAASPRVPSATGSHVGIGDLPATLARVTPAQRDAQLRHRRLGFERRIQTGPT